MADAITSSFTISTTWVDKTRERTQTTERIVGNGALQNTTALSAAVASSAVPTFLSTTVSTTTALLLPALSENASHLQGNTSLDEPHPPWANQTGVNFWVQAIASAGDGHFPRADAPSQEWRQWIIQCGRLPLVIVVLGIAVAAATLYFMWADKRHSVRARNTSAPQLQLLWRRFFVACFLTIVFCGTGLFNCVSLGMSSSNIAGQEVQRLETDLSLAEELTEALNLSGASFNRNLDRLYTDCPLKVQAMINESVASLKSDVSDYNSEIKFFHSVVHGLPEEISLFVRRSQPIAVDFGLLLGIPSAAAALCFIALSSLVLIAERVGPKCAKRCETCEHTCVGLSFVAPAILIVALLSAAELAACIGTASFCLHSDSVALDYLEATLQASPGALDLARFYFRGTTSSINPALQSVHRAESAISRSIAWVAWYREPLARSCPEWDFMNVTRNLLTVQHGLSQAADLLDPYTVYSFYDVSVHGLVCRNTVQGIIVLVAFQLILGFICIPVLALTASTLLDSLASERNMGFAFTPLGQEEGEEIEEWEDVEVPRKSGRVSLR